MASASATSSDPDNGKNIQRSAQGDWRLFLRLVPYIKRNQSQLILPLIMLVPAGFGAGGSATANWAGHLTD